MTLVERQVYLDQLQALLADARRGRGRVVVLTGDAGVGKSALARAFAGTGALDVRILWSACENLSTPDPLGPLHDLAREAKWDLPQALGKPGGRHAAFSECLGVFDDRTRTNLVVIEDVHWADSATLDFIRFLGRHIHNTHILLLVTVCGDEARGRLHLRRLLADVPSDDVLRIDVPLLTEGAVIGLAQKTSLDGRALYRATAGNAYFVTELLHTGRDDEFPQPRVTQYLRTPIVCLLPPGRYWTQSRFFHGTLKFL